MQRPAVLQAALFAVVCCHICFRAGAGFDPDPVRNVTLTLTLEPWCANPALVLTLALRQALPSALPTVTDASDAVLCRRVAAVSKPCGCPCLTCCFNALSAGANTGCPAYPAALICHQ